MSADALAPLGDWLALGQGELITRLNAIAGELRVTASTLKSRLVALRALTYATARAVPDAALRHNGRDVAGQTPQASFSQPLVEEIGLALEAGLVSVRRAATLLDLTTEDLRDLFAAHGVAQPAELRDIVNRRRIAGPHAIIGPPAERILGGCAAETVEDFNKEIRPGNRYRRRRGQIRADVAVVTTARESKSAGSRHDGWELRGCRNWGPSLTWPGAGVGPTFRPAIEHAGGSVLPCGRHGR